MPADAGTEAGVRPATAQTPPPRGLAARVTTAIRRTLGMPDYAAYIAHLRACHPGRPVPSERQFYDEYVRARYGDGPTRCC